MGLPVTFLIGAAILLLHDQFGESLPRQPHLSRVLPFLLLLPLPWLLLRWFAAKTLKRRPGSVASRRLRLLGGLLPFSVPLAYAAIVFGGDLVSIVASVARDSTLGFLVLALLPLLVMEVSYRVAEHRTAVRAANQGLALLAPIQLGLVWLVLVPILLMAGLSDATRAHRWLHVFMTSTALGHLCSFGVTVLVMSVALPLLFRFLLPTSRRLPPAIADDVHATAQALGFPARAVLCLHTDHRIPNAAMVGPLPWPRYLVLTDALMALLDPFSLRGVVAHEVGHARAGHPALLMLVFVVMPVLSFHAAWLWLYDVSGTTAILLLAGGLAAGIVCLRTIAHRFEYEADQLSAEALGGAAPCVEALRRVSRMWSRGNERSTLRHPADRLRIEQLHRWEHDPAERRRFAHAGRRLRRWIAFGVLLAAGACTWAQTWMWPLDAVQLAYYTGALPDAKRRLTKLSDRSNAPLVEFVDTLTLEVDAALELVPEGGTWESIQDRLTEGGIERGMRLLRAGDCKAAVPWLALSLSRPDPEPWKQTLYLIARAAADGDAARLPRLVAHLATLAPPEGVLQTVAGLQPSPERAASDR